MSRDTWAGRIEAAGWELVKVEVDGGKHVEVRDKADGSVVTFGSSRRSALMKAINVLDKRGAA